MAVARCSQVQWKTARMINELKAETPDDDSSESGRRSSKVGLTLEPTSGDLRR